MALRITASSLPAAEPDGASTPGLDADAAAAARIAATGAAALRSGDDATYLRQFELAAEIDDDSRRYQARRALVEHALAACQQAPRARVTEILVALASAAIRALEATPAEPLLLNYAGVALYELWALEAAQALFKAAGRLDPAVPHLSRNLSECAKRKRANGRPRRPLHAALPELARRARSVATRARPAEGLKISLCMIVRDEEEMLPRCLEAVAPAVDEIVIVDTGSQDRTIEIARSFGARVIEREWTGSFSDARNVSFDQATGDWLLYLDADEVLVSADIERLRALSGHTWREAFYFVETNFTGTEDSGGALTHSALRMFRNRPSYRFSGRLHEQIAQHLPAYVPERLHQTGVRIEHYGYLGAVRDAKEKSRRNIELLKAQMAESPPTPFLHFNLGSEHFAAGNPVAALAEYEQAWRMILAEPGERYEFTPSLVSRMVKALRACGRNQDAFARAAEGLQRFPGFTDLVYEQGAACLALGLDADATAHFERCIAMGDAPAGYTALVGCGTYLPRITLAEMHLRTGEVEQALELLAWCVEHHPGFAGVIHPYASALLRSRRPPAEVIAEIEARVPKMSPTVCFMLGAALFESGAAAEAEAQFRSVVERQPNSGPARVALAETLLYQRRYGEGADIAAALAEDSPLVAMAARSELFGRLAGGELDVVPAVLERAARGGLDAAERSLFASWHQRLRNPNVAPGTQVAIPAGAREPLATMLEAALRVQDFETFESLHGLLADSDVPLRDRRELLAQIYLRRGYLKSAAREWMAVCDEVPDLSALIGLGRIARARGLHDAAATFAREALAIDPRNAVAQALLAGPPAAAAPQPLAA